MFKIPLLWNQHNVYIVFESPEVAFEIVKEYFSEYDDVELLIEKSDFEDANWRTFYEDGIDPVIFIDREYLSDRESVQHIGHEATHAVRYVFEFLGEESANEVFAILVDEIIKEFMKHFLHDKF